LDPDRLYFSIHIHFADNKLKGLAVKSAAYCFLLINMNAISTIIIISGRQKKIKILIFA